MLLIYSLWPSETKLYPVRCLLNSYVELPLHLQGCLIRLAVQGKRSKTLSYDLWEESVLLLDHFCIGHEHRE